MNIFAMQKNDAPDPEGIADDVNNKENQTEFNIEQSNKDTIVNTEHSRRQSTIEENNDIKSKHNTLNETTDNFLDETKDNVLDETKDNILDETTYSITDETKHNITNETKDNILDETKIYIMEDTKHNFDEQRNITDETKHIIDEKHNNTDETNQNTDLQSNINNKIKPNIETMDKNLTILSNETEAYKVNTNLSGDNNQVVSKSNGEKKNKKNWRIIRIGGKANKNFDSLISGGIMLGL